MAIWLTVIIGVTQLFLGGMGVYVSLKPPEKKYHWHWITMFILVGLAGVGLTTWLAEATDKAQSVATHEVHDAQVAATNANNAATNANTAATNAANAATAAQHEIELARTEARKGTTETQ